MLTEYFGRGPRGCSHPSWLRLIAVGPEWCYSSAVNSAGRDINIVQVKI